MARKPVVRANLLRLNPKKSDPFLAKIERMTKLIEKQAPDIVRQANAEGLAFVQRRALENLQGSMKASRRPFRTGVLEAAIMDPKYSRSDLGGFKFFNDKLIRPDVPYYGSLEFGSSKIVGHQIPFIFLSTPGGSRGRGNSRRSPKLAYSIENNPDPARSNGHRRADGKPSHPGISRTRVTDRIVGPREVKNLNRSDPNVRAHRDHQGHTVGEGVRLVTITRPVPEYAYGRRAGEQYVSGQHFGSALRKKLGATGLDKLGVDFILGR